MLLHYSVRFNQEDVKYHSEVSFYREVAEDYKKYLDEMILSCKLALIKSIKIWGYNPDQLVFSEFYFHIDGEEIRFFDWSKP